MNKQVQVYVEKLFLSDALNRLPEEYGGGSIYAKPLIGVARGDDPIFEVFKRAVAPEHLTPAEMWSGSGFPCEENLGARLRIVSIVFPYVPEIREAGEQNRGDMPPEIYCVARNLADAFIRAVLDRVADFLQEHGHRATSGIESRAFRMLSNEEPRRIYANWSERHVAFAAGLGTFSLHEALITEAGCNVRLGSVVTDAPLGVTSRRSDDPYANCLHFAKGTCGACIEKCPAGAITEDGHDKNTCRLYGAKVREEMLGRPVRSVLRSKHLKINDEDRVTYSVGCALCQFGVPCMARNPMAADEPLLSQTQF